MRNPGVDTWAPGRVRSQSDSLERYPLPGGPTTLWGVGRSVLDFSFPGDKVFGCRTLGGELTSLETPTEGYRRHENLPGLGQFFSGGPERKHSSRKGRYDYRHGCLGECLFVSGGAGGRAVPGGCLEG